MKIIYFHSYCFSIFSKYLQAESIYKLRGRIKQKNSQLIVLLMINIRREVISFAPGIV